MWSLAKFANVINQKNVYRRFLVDIEIVIFPEKIDIKIICMLETDIINCSNPQKRNYHS